MIDANKNAIAIGDEVTIRGHIRGVGPKSNVTIQLAKQLTPGTFTVVDVDAQHVSKVVSLTAAQIAEGSTGKMEKVSTGTIAKDTSLMTFMVTIPEASHGNVAGALEKNPSVKLNSDRRSGTSKNPDGSVTSFKLVKGDQFEVTVLENPQNMPREYFVTKVTEQIESFLNPGVVPAITTATTVRPPVPRV
jgi:hypothetical protein